jgi:hypothetical protein
MTDTIRLTDLAAPQYTAEAQALLDAVAAVPVDLSLAGVLAAAREQCDVAFYEDPGLLERVQVFLSAVAEDTNLSAMGRMTIAMYLQRHLVQRSRLEALYLAHPEIAAEEIQAPIIIAGLPRSGTTHLLNLISADTRLRSLRYWESLEPIPSQATLSGDAEDERYANGLAQLAMQDAMMPYFQNMYDVRNDSIHEEIELQFLDASTLLQANLANIPQWEDYYYGQDQTPHYEFLKRVLKALQWLRGPRRWVLKSPQHLAFLPVLHKVFPDATYVVTHRDPVGIFTSWVTMLSYTARMSRDPVDLTEVSAQALRIQEALLKGVTADISALPAEQVVQVYFDEFMKDDFGVLEQIYGKAGLSLDAATRASIQRYRDEHQRGHLGKIQYDLEGDFGLSRTELYQRFAAYLDAFPVQRESENS